MIKINKSVLIVIIVVFFYTGLNAQNKLHVTDSLRAEGNYELELNYHLLFYKENPKYPANTYNMACCYAILNNIDSAFYFLNIAIDLGQNDGWLLADYDLKNLHADKRWVEIEKRLENIYKEKNVDINTSLGWELSKMYFADQAPKNASDNIYHRYGMSSPQMDSINKVIYFIDSMNVLKLESMMNKYGNKLFNKDTVGLAGIDHIFIIILHAPLSYQKKYFYLIEESVKRGVMEKQSIAYLTDKILTKEGKKQLYGTQLQYSSETHSYVLKPIEDEANINLRRQSLGMSTIEEYAKRWDIIYKSKALQEPVNTKSCIRPIENKEIGFCNSTRDTLTYIQLKNCKELTVLNKKQTITSYRLTYYLIDSTAIIEHKGFSNQLPDEIISGIITNKVKKVLIEDIIGTEGTTNITIGGRRFYFK